MSVYKILTLPKTSIVISWILLQATKNDRKARLSIEASKIQRKKK